MERAIAEGWVKPPPEEEGGPDVWKSSGHRELVSLCDDQCYADMGFDAVNRHKEAILALCEKIGWVPSVKQGPVHKVSRSEQEVALESAAKED